MCSILYTCFVHQKLVTRAHLLELSGRCILLKFKNAMNFCSGLFIASHTGYDSYGRCNCTCIGVPYLTVLLLVSEQWAVLALVFTLQMLCRRLVSRCCSLGLDEWCHSGREVMAVRLTLQYNITSQWATGGTKFLQKLNQNMTQIMNAVVFIRYMK